MKQKLFLTLTLLLAFLTACGSAAAEPESEIEQQILAQSQPVMEKEIPMEEWENAELYQDIDQEDVEKTVITLGTLHQYDELEWLVSRFNAASDTYTAQLKYYDDLSTLATFIVAGDGPDVLFLMSVPYSQYIKSGAFLPLGDIYDAAENYEPKLRDLIAEQFEEQIMIASYSFACISAPKYVLQGRTSWTFDEFMEIAPDTNVFQKFTKELCLGLYCSNNLSEYVDVVKNTCSFDSEEFCRVLQFANQFLEDESQLVNDGRGSDIQLTMSCDNIQSLDTRSYEADFWHCSPSTYLGYPSNTGAGIMIYPDLQLAVLASTKQEAGAKALVAYALTPDFQEFIGSQYRTPVLQDVLREQITSFFTTGDYEKHPIADDMLAKIEDMWDRTTGICYIDHALYNIVMEEAEYYFTGAKTVEEVASLIQNRAQLYLSEQA